MTQYPLAKAGQYPRKIPNCQNCACCEKDLKDNKHDSLHLGWKYAQVFVLGHYLFLVAQSFRWATLSKNFSLLGTDNVSRQIPEHIFTPNEGYCLQLNGFVQDRRKWLFRVKIFFLQKCLNFCMCFSIKVIP